MLILPNQSTHNKLTIKKIKIIAIGGVFDVIKIDN
jgi:hypothetical protein